jgi:hypothetical protein
MPPAPRDHDAVGGDLAVADHVPADRIDMVQVAHIGSERLRMTRNKLWHVLFCARNSVETAIEVSLQNTIANVSEEARRQHTVVKAGRFYTRHGVEIRAGPDEIIRLRHDNPRSQIVETKVAFQRGGNLDGVSGFGWARVCNRHNRRRISAFDDLAHGHNRARTIFVAFFGSPAMFARPQVRIANHKTRTRYR